MMTPDRIEAASGCAVFYTGGEWGVKDALRERFDSGALATEGFVRLIRERRQKHPKLALAVRGMGALRMRFGSQREAWSAIESLL